MDFEIIVWLVILFFFFLSRMIGRGKKPQRRPEQEQPHTEAAEARPDASLEDALREIREALGQPARKPEQKPSPRPAEPVATRPRPTTPRPADKEVQHRGDGGFHDTVLVDRSKQPPQRRPETPRPPAPRPQQARPQQPRPTPQQRAQRPAQAPAPLRPTTQPSRQKEHELGDTPAIDQIMSVYDRDPDDDRRGFRHSELAAVLKDKQEIQKAMKLQEILGPCRANRPYRSGGHIS